MLCSRDRELLDDQRYASAFADTVREGLRAGTSGGGWDNVSWIGEWDIDLSAVRCPVLLWYGSDDRFAQPAHRVWLSEHLPRARLVVHDGEGISGFSSISAPSGCARCTSAPAAARASAAQYQPYVASSTTFGNFPARAISRRSS